MARKLLAQSGTVLLFEWEIVRKLLVQSKTVLLAWGADGFRFRAGQSCFAGCQKVLGSEQDSPAFRECGGNLPEGLSV